MAGRNKLTCVYLIVTGLVLIGLFSGCSSDKSTGPLSRLPDTNAGRVLPQSKVGVSADSLGPGKGLSIDGAVGGVIKASRFTLTVPPGAFDGVQTIVLQPGKGKDLICNFLPEGLQFKIPATLEINVGNSTADATDATVLWLDPATLQWVDVGGFYQSGKHTVTANLYHFCTYAGGRGGW